MGIDLKNILIKDELSRKDKILLILYYNDSLVKTVGDIKSIGKSNGLREIEKWNVSMVLISLKALAIKLPEGWTITIEGQKYLKSLNLIPDSPIVLHHQKLKAYAQNISSVYVREFINEAINALEFGLLKSAVVFSWIGAVSLINENVEKNHLQDFNVEAKRRFPNWTHATNIDGLTRMKEYDYLQVLEKVSVIGKSTKNELEHCLQLRNSCGHPSTLKIGENIVAAHIETLILNVYNKFS